MNGPDEFVGVRLTTKAFFDIVDCQYPDELLIGIMDTVRDVSQHPELPEAAFKKGQALGASLAGAALIKYIYNLMEGIS
jgi:hypothetical protein